MKLVVNARIEQNVVEWGRELMRARYDEAEIHDDTTYRNLVVCSVTESGRVGPVQVDDARVQHS